MSHRLTILAALNLYAAWAQPALAADLVPGPSGAGIQGLRDVNGIVYFVAATGVAPYEVWRTEGTAASTFRVQHQLTAGAITLPNTVTRFRVNANGSLFNSAGSSLNLSLVLAVFP